MELTQCYCTERGASSLLPREWSLATRKKGARAKSCIDPQEPALQEPALRIWLVRWRKQSGIRSYWLNQFDEYLQQFIEISQSSQEISLPFGPVLISMEILVNIENGCWLLARSPSIKERDPAL